MHTGTSIHISAPREQVFDFVSDLQRWPALLPHYRFVEKLSAQADGRETFRMSANREPGIPITWVSAYEAHRPSLELRFEHLRAWTKGMIVVWTLTPEGDGTLVRIVHDLRFRVPALGWLVEPIIGGFFIENIARKTLRCFKQHLETPTPR